MQAVRTGVRTIAHKFSLLYVSFEIIVSGYEIYSNKRNLGLKQA